MCKYDVDPIVNDTANEKSLYQNIRNNDDSRDFLLHHNTKRVAKNTRDDFSYASIAFAN